MIKSLLFALLISYLAICAYAWFLAERRIFRPPVSSYTRSVIPVEMIMTADDVEVAVLQLHNPEARYTILYHHGNAEDIGHIYPILKQVRDAGFSVVALDYRGYGVSARRSTTVKGAILDAEAAYGYATESLGVDPSQLILLGRSVGSGPATDLASRFPAAGLIIEGGFVSTFRVVTGLPLLPFDHFPNLRLIRDLDIPILIIHGDRDAVINVRHGRKLFAAAAEPKQMLEVSGGGHSDLMSIAADEYLSTLNDFAETLTADSVD